jgi:hypothetical protein
MNNKNPIRMMVGTMTKETKGKAKRGTTHKT